jgi:hypothetical protein
MLRSSGELFLLFPSPPILRVIIPRAGPLFKHAERLHLSPNKAETANGHIKGTAREGHELMALPPSKPRPIDIPFLCTGKMIPDVIAQRSVVISVPYVSTNSTNRTTGTNKEGPGSNGGIALALSSE